MSGAPLFTLVIFMTFHNIVAWNGASPFADQTSRMQNWKEVNVWSSTVYSSDFHEGRQYFITFACVEFCFLKKQFL